MPRVHLGRVPQRGYTKKATLDSRPTRAQQCTPVAGGELYYEESGLAAAVDHEPSQHSTHTPPLPALAAADTLDLPLPEAPFLSEAFFFRILLRPLLRPMPSPPLASAYPTRNCSAVCQVGG